MPMKIEFDATESPAEDDVNFVLKELRAFNRSKAALTLPQKMAVFARDENGRIVGGVTGEVNWSWLYVDLLWVDESCRDRGFGSQLLGRMEEMAQSYDVVGFHLGTTDFQALDFYKKQGYDVWGQLSDFPPGHTNYSLRKLNPRYSKL